MPSEGPYGSHGYSTPQKTIIEQVDDMEKEIARLEGENKNLHRIREELLKENKKLKQALKMITKIQKEKEWNEIGGTTAGADVNWGNDAG